MQFSLTNFCNIVSIQSFNVNSGIYNFDTCVHTGKTQTNISSKGNHCGEQEEREQEQEENEVNEKEEPDKIMTKGRGKNDYNNSTKTIRSSGRTPKHFYLSLTTK